MFQDIPLATAEIQGESQQEDASGFVDGQDANTSKSGRVVEALQDERETYLFRDSNRLPKTRHTNSLQKFAGVLPGDAVRTVQEDGVHDGNFWSRLAGRTATMEGRTATEAEIECESVACEHTSLNVAKIDGFARVHHHLSAESEVSILPPGESANTEPVAASNQPPKESSIDPSNASMQVAHHHPLAVNGDGIIDKGPIVPVPVDPIPTYGSKRTVTKLAELSTIRHRKGTLASDKCYRENLQDCPEIPGIEHVSNTTSESSYQGGIQRIGGLLASRSEEAGGDRALVERRRRDIHLHGVLSIPRTIIRTFGSSVFTGDVDLEMQGIGSSESSISPVDDISVSGGDRDSLPATSASQIHVPQVQRTGHRQRAMTTYEKCRLALVVIVAAANIVVL